MRNAAFSSLDDLSGGILGKGKDFANTLAAVDFPTPLGPVNKQA